MIQTSKRYVWGILGICFVGAGAFLLSELRSKQSTAHLILNEVVNLKIGC